MVDQFVTLIKKNFFLIGVTAFPGLHKLALLFVVNQVDSVDGTADFISDIFILYFLGYYTVFNWSNFILADMIKLPEQSHVSFFGKIAGLSLIYNVPVLIVLFILFRLEWLTDFFGFALFILTWSYHQLWRHFFIAKKLYNLLFFTDVVVLILSLISIIVGHEYGVNRYFIMSIPVLIVPILFKYLPPILARKKMSIRVFKKAMNYTLINMSTGGIQLIFAPLSHQLLMAELTRIIGFTTNFASVVLLIPRALSFQFIPQLSDRLRRNKKQCADLFLLFSQKINQSILAMLVVGILTGFFIWITWFELPFEMIILSFMVYINLLLGQLAAPSSNVLVVLSQSSYLLKVNVVSFIIVVLQIFLMLSAHLDPLVKMYIIIGFNVLVGVLRFLWLRSYVSRLI